MAQMWWVIGGALLVIIIVILILVWFRGGGTKAFDTIDDQLGGLQDCDGDNAADRFDECPCDPSKTEKGEGTCGGSSTGDCAGVNCNN